MDRLFSMLKKLSFKSQSAILLDNFWIFVVAGIAVVSMSSLLLCVGYWVDTRHTELTFHIPCLLFLEDVFFIFRLTNRG